VSGVAFRILHRTVDRRLAAGQLTVVDATNLAAAARRPFIQRARGLAYPAVAIVLDLDPETVRAQNAARPRIVDPDVVDRHLAAIRMTVDGGLLAIEGFDPIVILRTPVEAAGLVVARGPSRV
jgi:protein phosphatase